MNQPIIVLLRQDLRLNDNPALWHAAQTGAPIIVLYILDDKLPGQWKIGQAQRWWLHHSLKHLSSQLAEQQVTLLLKSGNTQSVLTEVVRLSNAKALFYNRCYEPFWVSFEKSLAIPGIEIQSFNSALLIEPWMISTKQGTPYKVFTQFWNTASKDLELSPPLPKPTLVGYQNKKIQSETLDEWHLLPKSPNWAREFSSLWEPGESGAQDKLELFITSGLDRYAIDRDVPSIQGTSMLSPHLHFGEIGPKQIVYRLQHLRGDVEDFVRELGWREFTYYSLFHFQKLPENSYQDRFNQFPWKTDPAVLKAWQKGLVGYPIVDAGMRQLWHTGTMHNRVRMIVGSFLTKDLLIPWQEGEKWFWDTLLDADLASNAFNWQWVAGSGMDAAPFFRIFNPVLQGQKFDPDGEYVRRWVPELGKLPAKYIHEPWEAPPLLLRELEITLGKTYPYPIVDHKQARDTALRYFKQI